MNYLKKLKWTDLFRENFLLNFSANYSKYQLDIIRVFLSLFAIISILAIILDYDLLLSPNGLINWEVNNANLLWFEFNPYKIADYLHVQANHVIITILVIYILSLLGLLIGFYTRVSSVIALLLFLFISNILSNYGYGVDVYQTVVLFVFCIFPSGYWLAFKKRATTINSREIQQICIRVLQLYLCITYANAGLGKFVMTDWWNGRFIFFLLNDPTYVSTTALTYMHPIIYKILGVATVITESFYILFVCIPIARSICVITIILMHLFIAFGMGLFSFGMLLILLNIGCWYPYIIKDYKKIKSYVTHL